MVIRRRLNQDDLKICGYLPWNAFIDLLAMESFDDLSERQRLAHLVFWYSSEVENGGHLQYFLNQGTQHLGSTISALAELGMNCYEQILVDASSFIKANWRPEIDTVDEYVTEALENRLGTFDARYGECEKRPDRYLEDYLNKYFEDFIELTLGESDKLESSIDI